MMANQQAQNNAMIANSSTAAPTVINNQMQGGGGGGAAVVVINQKKTFGPISCLITVLTGGLVCPWILCCKSPPTSPLPIIFRAARRNGR